VRSLNEALDALQARHQASEKPLAVVLAGHNGSGKSTMWYHNLVATLQIPLVNADRMMMSILPEVNSGLDLPKWAVHLRDQDKSWMKVAQKGVEAFVGQAMGEGLPFAMETVFSHWKEHPDGRIESKIDLIREMQDAGYFVLLFFVGLTSDQLSVGRVLSRVASGGHDVEVATLLRRFPRTQRAIREASAVADGTILVDNSRSIEDAFTVCRAQLGDEVLFDLRETGSVPIEIESWLNVVSPRA
jgi:predicted ABC-type ATPase